MPKATLSFEPEISQLTNVQLVELGVFVRRKLAAMIEKTEDWIDWVPQPLHPCAIMSSVVTLEIEFISSPERLAQLSLANLENLKKDLDNLIRSWKIDIREGGISIWTKPLGEGSLHIM